jgi:hypothetical protein
MNRDSELNPRVNSWGRLMTEIPPVDPLADVAAALQTLDELVITVDFDSEDPDSIEAAIRTVEAMIDATVAPYRGHPIVESTVAELKAECRAGLQLHAEQTGAFTLGNSSAPTKLTLH